MKGKKTLLWERLNPGDPGALVVEVHGPVLEKRQCHQEPSPKAGLEQVVNCSCHPVPNNGSCAEATFLHSGPISWCNQIYIQVANTPFCVLKQSAEAKSFPLCFQFHRYHQGLPPTRL